MSFILDALKKSEVERQRQSMPGLIDATVAQRRRSSRWWLLLAALLAINLIVLLLVLLRGAAPQPSPRRSAAAPLDRENPVAATSSPADPHFSPLDRDSSYAPEIPMHEDRAEDAANGSTGTSSNAERMRAHPAPHQAPAVETAGLRSGRRPEPVLIDAQAETDNQEVLPSINEINLTGADALPDIHLDVHVYATKSTDRFVYINMRKYHEGNTLQEGPVLERIRRDGVVLDYRGLRFIVPRQP